jgi:hypothetical protein
MKPRPVESGVTEVKSRIISPSNPGIRVVVIRPWVRRRGDDAMPRIGIGVLVATVI